MLKSWNKKKIIKDFWKIQLPLWSIIIPDWYNQSSVFVLLWYFSEKSIATLDTKKYTLQILLMLLIISNLWNNQIIINKCVSDLPKWCQS